MLRHSNIDSMGNWGNKWQHRTIDNCIASTANVNAIWLVGHIVIRFSVQTMVRGMHCMAKLLDAKWGETSWMIWFFPIMTFIKNLMPIFQMCSKADPIPHWNINANQMGDCLVPLLLRCECVCLLFFAGVVVRCTFMQLTASCWGVVLSRTFRIKVHKSTGTKVLPQRN